MNTHGKFRVESQLIQAFSLVEITLSLGLLAFCMITLVGLLPAGLRTQEQAQEESRATAALN